MKNCKHDSESVYYNINPLIKMGNVVIDSGIDLDGCETLSVFSETSVCFIMLCAKMVAMINDYGCHY